VAVAAGILTAFLIPAEKANADRPLAELYKSGKVRFVPEMTITDEAMGGKEFFGLPMDIVVDDKGSLYVCDYKENNIKRFDAAGKFLGTIGKKGQGPGDLNGPNELEFSRERVYVREGMNMRVSILKPDGSVIKLVPIDFQKGFWQAMRALPDGRFVVQKEIVHREDLNAPQDFILELYSSDLDFIKSIYERQIRRNKYINEPRYGNIPIPFSPDVYWDVTPDGKIVLGYSKKYEIDFYDLEKGKVSSFSHRYTPVEVGTQDKDQFFQGIMVATMTDAGERNVKRGAPDYMIKNTEFPKIFPAFRDIKVDLQGNVWIIPWTSRFQKTGGIFDAFATDGEFLSRVQVEKDEFIPYRPFWLPNGFWCTKANTNEEYRIVKYKITG
jgi:hypothetical protein